jgi:hypothetical protein
MHGHGPAAQHSRARQQRKLAHALQRQRQRHHARRPPTRLVRLDARREQRNSGERGCEGSEARQHNDRHTALFPSSQPRAVSAGPRSRCRDGRRPRDEVRAAPCMLDGRAERLAETEPPAEQLRHHADGPCSRGRRLVLDVRPGASAPPRSCCCCEPRCVKAVTLCDPSADGSGAPAASPRHFTCRSCPLARRGVVWMLPSRAAASDGQGHGATARLLCWRHAAAPLKLPSASLARPRSASCAGFRRSSDTRWPRMPQRAVRAHAAHTCRGPLARRPTRSRLVPHAGAAG